MKIKPVIDPSKLRFVRVTYIPGTRVIGGTIGKKAAMMKTGMVAHFGGFNFEREYPEIEPIVSVRKTVPIVINELFNTWRGKFWVGSSKVLKFAKEKEKLKDESIIDLFGKKARITVHTIGISVTAIANKRMNSKEMFTLRFLMSAAKFIFLLSSFLQGKKIQQSMLILQQYKD